MFKKNRPLLLITLICIIVGLFTSLTPFLEIEFDGQLDSHFNDALYLSAFIYVTGLFILLIQLFSAYLAVPQHFSFLLVPPPISTK